MMSAISNVPEIEMNEAETQLPTMLDGATPNPITSMSQGTEAGQDPTGLHSDYQQLLGQVLDDRFVLGTPIRNDNHSVVFSVEYLCSDDGTSGSSELLPEQNVTFKARVYDLRNISMKLKRYRLRSMKRMASREVFQQQWRHLEIIVYVAGNINFEDHGLDDEVPSGLARSDTKDINQSASTVNRKTEYHRESDRLRQRDKRRAKRGRNAVARAHSPGPELPAPTSSAPRGIVDFDDATNAMFFLIHFAFNPRQEVRDELPPDKMALMEAYLQKRGKIPTFQSAEEAADFASIKQKELISLRRIAKQLPKVKDRCHDQLGEDLKQLQLMKTIDEKKQFQEGTIEMRKARFRILKTVQDNLPGLIRDTVVVSTLVEKLLAVFHDDQNKREVKNLKSWLHHVVPASDLYDQIFSRLQAAEAKSKVLENQLKSRNS